MILVYDTETTGLPIWKEPSEDPKQPHIVQIAALLVSDDLHHVAASINLTVAADGWEIPAEVEQVHGISTARSKEIGVPETAALDAFLALDSVANERIAFNSQFDDRIIRIALMRYRGETAAELFKQRSNAVCAMKAAANALGLGKFVKLTEAYDALGLGAIKHQAHTAWGDAHMALEIMRELRARTAA